MLQEIIVNLQTESNITICICDHQARDLLSCVDVAVILSNCKIVAQGSPIGDPCATILQFDKMTATSTQERRSRAW